ncbi:MAG: phosphate signaling complex protein PhoU [Blastocatellia bacterium]|nr:phosphate signaling complex protein PhoU [Blastocatellia bacterium]
MEKRIIDQQLDTLRDKVLLLGGKAESAVQRAMTALATRDSKLAEVVLEDDKIINQMELEIDRMSVEIIALYQPAAHDLRLVISVAKITPVLERLADHAGNIAEAVLIINNEPELPQYPDLKIMSDAAAEMLRNALDAFIAEDGEAARKIILEDKKIDASYKKVFGELIGGIINDPTTTTSAAQLLFVAKHLERIGDYVKDICELTVYLAEASIIKHSPNKD